MACAAGATHCQTALGDTLSSTTGADAIHMISLDPDRRNSPLERLWSTTETLDVSASPWFTLGKSSLYPVRRNSSYTCDTRLPLFNEPGV
jgi:hypothetical protein